MSGDKQVNGKANGQEDVDMNDASGSKKPGKGKDGDESMTVVVPPSKKSKSAEAGSGADGEEEAIVETPVDPKEKAISGKLLAPQISNIHADSSRNQRQL